MLRVDDVYVSYFGDVYILEGVSINVERNSITAVVGPNGAGKTTLLKTIYGFLKPKRGKIYYKGKDITGRKPYRMIGDGLGYVPQRRSIFPDLTVSENLEMGAWTVDPGKFEDALENVYNIFPVLREKKDYKAENLSGGEQRLLEIARVLITNPELILLDEPTTGLAPKLALEFYEHLVNLRRQNGTAILLVDQNIREAVEISDYIYLLELGKVKSEGRREDLLRKREGLKSLIGL